MNYKLSEKVITFLINDLGLSENSIELGLKISNKNKITLPVALWSHSLISTDELDRLYKFIWS